MKPIGLGEQMTKEERQARFYRAAENAKRILKPGDRIRAHRCGGIVATYIFAGWDGNWIVSKSGIPDIAPTCVDRLNGAPVDFTSDGTAH